MPFTYFGCPFVSVIKNAIGILKLSDSIFVLSYCVLLMRDRETCDACSGFTFLRHLMMCKEVLKGSIVFSCTV